VRRRDLLVGGVAAAWSSPASPQRSGRQVRIAVLMPYPTGDSEGQARLDAFSQSLADLGWSEGKNLRLDTEWAGASGERIMAAAREIAASRPDLILAVNTPVATAAAKETRTVPIIFASVTDPVGIGIVENLASSGRNVTGFTNFEFSVGGKWLGIIQAIAPQVRRAAVLFSPNTAPYAPAFLDVMNTAGRALSLDIQTVPVTDASGLAEATKEPVRGGIRHCSSFPTCLQPHIGRASPA
jgi:putative tryptophan/tyrosine transport system substrate-binding protein